MNVLIAGYGSIGKSIHSLIKAHPLTWIDEIFIAEIKDGLSAQKMISDKKNELDLVINVTTDDDGSILKLCREHKIHYLDTGLEIAKDIIDLLPQKETSGTVNLYGFGMNPGLIEFMYRKQKLNTSHSVVEIEHDTAEMSDAVFGTWSPKMYYCEAVEEPPFAYINGEVRDIARSANGPDIQLEIDGRQPKNYLWIPHEEVYSIGKSNRNCHFAAFLYSAPKMIQSLALECRKTGEQFPDLPVRHKIKGSDTVGILLMDDQGESRYVYNRASHQDCYARYSINATCWQVACGIYAGISIMASLKPGGYTMSTIPESFFPQVDKCLAELDFMIESRKVKPSDKLKNLSVKLAGGGRVSCCRFDGADNRC